MERHYHSVNHEGKCAGCDVVFKDDAFSPNHGPIWDKDRTSSTRYFLTKNFFELHYRIGYTIREALWFLDVLDLAREVVRRHYHRHTDRCYGSYEVCGEHHAHDDKCGSRPLWCRTPESSDIINKLHDALEIPKS